MQLCDAVRVPEVIIAKEIENIRGHWFYTNRAFNYGADAITPSTFAACRSTFRLDRSLKRLHLQGNYSDYKHLDFNNFTQLEELQFECKFTASEYPTTDEFVQISEELVINLPNLKVLDCDVTEPDHFLISHFDFQLVLVTPKLEKLKLARCVSISLTHPDTIQHLEVGDYVGTIGDIAHLLTNVQYLKVDHLQDVDGSDSGDYLMQYPKLHTLVVNTYDCVTNYIMDHLRQLVELKRQLKRTDVRIYFQLIELVDVAQIDEWESTRSIFEILMNNYSSLRDCVATGPYVVNYNELMKLVDGSLPNDFFQKFRNLRYVHVERKVSSQEDFLQFLKRLEYLKVLYVWDDIFDQSFFDGLHEISGLTVLRLESTSSSIVSYDFLLELKLLAEFRTYHHAPELFDLSLALFKKLKYFEKIEFASGRELIMIRKRFNSNENQYWLGRYERETWPDGGYRTGLIFDVDAVDFEHLARLVNEHKSITLVQ